VKLEECFVIALGTFFRSDGDEGVLSRYSLSKLLWQSIHFVLRLCHVTRKQDLNFGL